MKEDQINYRNNLQIFTRQIENSFVDKISFNLDANPTFEKSAIPFNFYYCKSIRINTDKADFDIFTSMTDIGIETFWIIESTDPKSFSTYLEVNSRVKSIELTNGIENYAFKIKIEFENIKLSLFSGEIYEKSEGDFKYQINEEMILAFVNEKDAETFVNLTNYERRKG